MYYRICRDCGAHLDPDECCDCHKKIEAAPLQRERPKENTTTSSLSGNRPEVKEKGGRFYG